MDVGIMASVVLRKMKGSPHFVRNEEVSSKRPAQIEENEIVAGTYRNPPPWEMCELIFTDRAIYVLESDDVVRIPWDDIVDYEIVDPRAAPDGVRIRLRDGIRFVRVGGEYGPGGRFRDAFNLAMVLRSLLGR
jgi:hypothetical protein